MSDQPGALTPDATLALLLDILTKAAAAHGIHEATDLGGQRDEDWPTWYAAHMAATLASSGYVISGPTP
jgi:hypothetical protein